jgi:membrane fusion protein (multidrug efflux system)
MNRGARILRLRLGLGLAVAATSAACRRGGGGEESATAAAARPAELGPQDVAVARRDTVSPSVVLTGSLDPLRIAVLKSQVPGTIARLHAERGDTVRRGQLLAEIQAEGIRSQATGAQAAVASAQANLAVARRQLESARLLHSRGALSDIDYRNAEAQYEAAESQLAAARAQAAGASENAARASVRSPLNGVVSARAVNEGEPVSPDDPLFTVVNSDTLELSGQISVQQAARVREGQPVTFTLDAYPGREFTGRVARIDPVADPATRRVGASLRLANPGGKIVGGQFVTGRILGANPQAALVVPQAAVRGAEEGEPYVLAIEADTVARRPVRLGPVDAARRLVAVDSGLTAGLEVVTVPSVTLPPGAPVRLVARDSTSDTAREARAP